MGLENLKRWHWLVIALLVGAGFGYFWSGPDSVESDNVTRFSQFEFERDLVWRDPKTNEPILSDIVVHPAVKDFAGKSVQIVTFNALKRGATTGATYRVPGQFLATEPYKPFIRRLTTLSNDGSKTAKTPTVTDLLDQVAKQNDQIKYRYGWWNERPAAMGLWMLGSVVVIGGLWPTLLNLMIGAGFGPKRRTKVAKEESYLDRFGKGESTDATLPARSVAVGTAEQQTALDDMNRKLEEQLQAAGISTNFDATVPQEEDPEGPILAPTVRQLNGVGADPVQVGKKANEEDEVEVKGEFYPVLIHHKKGDGK